MFIIKAQFLAYLLTLLARQSRFHLGVNIAINLTVGLAITAVESMSGKVAVGFFR